MHKAGSALTMLGIIFGVVAVVAMMAIGKGAKEETEPARTKAPQETTTARTET